MNCFKVKKKKKKMFDYGMTLLTKIGDKHIIYTGSDKDEENFYKCNSK